MPSINNFLQGFTDGLPGMKDFRHASRLYLDDNFRLAPKNKFLYHVVFDINDVAMAPAMGAALLQNNEKIELNMLRFQIVIWKREILGLILMFQ